MMCTVCGRTDQPYSNRQLKRMRTGGAVAVCKDCCTAKQAARSVGKSARLEAATAEVTADAHPLRPRVFLEDPQSLYLLDWVVPAGGIPLGEPVTITLDGGGVQHVQLALTGRRLWVEVPPPTHTASRSAKLRPGYHGCMVAPPRSCSPTRWPGSPSCPWSWATHRPV